MKKIALIIDTNSRYADAWPACFGRLKKHFPNEIKKYVFVDAETPERVPPPSVSALYSEGDCNDFHPVHYDDLASYRSQFLSCLKQVEEPFIVYTSEDYILYDNVDQDLLESLVSLIEESEGWCNSIKLIRGPEALTGQYKPAKYRNLHIIDRTDNNFFAQQASIWRTKDLIKLFECSPPDNGRMEQEPGGSEICRNLGFNILQYYSGEPLRGVAHCDSTAYPYIATAIVKGKWNVSEYPSELKAVFAEYDINPTERGSR